MSRPSFLKLFEQQVDPDQEPSEPTDLSQAPGRTKEKLAKAAEVGKSVFNSFKKAFDFGGSR